MFFYLLFVFSYAMSAFGSPNIVVRIISEDDGAPRLLPPPIQVHTYASTFAPGSKPWLDVMSQCKDDFPNLVFQSHWVTPDEVQDGKVFAFPYTKIKDGEREHVFNLPLEYRYIKRWLTDVQHGRYGLFENVSALDTSISESYPVYVHILSDQKPPNRYARVLPEVGFFWTFMNQTKYFNTVILRGVDGKIHQRNNFSEFELFHTLLPPIIPSWMLDTPAGNAIYNRMSVRDIEIVYDGDLEPWWSSLALEFPQTAFVHYRSNETNLKSPSVWFRRRSVVFMIDSVGLKAKHWLRGIKTQETRPWNRPSKTPDILHDKVVDVTGDTYWSWISNHPTSVLLLYNDTYRFDIDQYTDALTDANYTVGQMNMDFNDHENLPIDAMSGTCLEYKSKRLVQMAECSSFQMPIQYTGKMEL